MLRSDICIAGAGIIGLALALELAARGLGVVVVERGEPLAEASTAAAGMLAANDPFNPSQLAALSRLSVSLYPGFLDRIERLGGRKTPFQTSRTMQALRTGVAQPLAALPTELLMRIAEGRGPLSIAGFRVLDEQSIDPRQLAASLLAAVEAATVQLLRGSPATSIQANGSTVTITTPSERIDAAQFIDCTGAWASDAAFAVRPVKGQMLAVELPAEFPLAITVRTEHFYIVPRTAGPNAGRAIIGATVEDAGFDKEVHAAQIEALHRQVAGLLPQIANANVVESWSGLRPATLDGLPLIGAHPTQPDCWLATGHYRNGILLAPATAHVMAQLLLGEQPATPLAAFAPCRPGVSRV
jgi:glycine oxidase